MDFKKMNKGITLVALVITIIILLILAGITILQLTGSGLFENARLAEKKYNNTQEKEDETLADYENKIGEYVDSSRAEITPKVFIDTSRQIACVGQSTDWCTNSYTYTATEDCAILGRTGSNNGGTLGIYINSVNVGSIRTKTALGYSSVNYYIKKGDTIEFKYEGTSGTIYVAVYAYGLK